VRAARAGEAIELEAREAAGLQDTFRFAKVREDHVGAWDVLENSIGVDEIEMVVGEEGEIAAAGVVQVGVRNVLKLGARLGNHFVGNVDAVDCG
jgi:hypothetical protein